MAATTEIAWADATFNPWRGCTKVSDGCKNCYAETNLSVKMHGIKWGPNGERRIASDAMWKEPLRWNKHAAEGRCRACQGAGLSCSTCGGTGTVEPYRLRVFCASLADVFEAEDTMPADSIPAVNEARLRLFNLIQKTPHLDWLLLTKRPENIERVLKGTYPTPFGVDLSGANGFIDAWMDRVWIGTTVENQKAADERIPGLLKVNAKVRFLSVEPMLGPVNLSNGYISADVPGRAAPLMTPYINLIDWVIVGGESGSHARPFDIAWARSIVSQCKAAGVPVFVKQLGAKPFASNGGCHPGLDDCVHLSLSGGACDCCGRLPHVLDKKGGDINEWPEDLRVRELPEVAR